MGPDRGVVHRRGELTSLHPCQRGFEVPV
jgi:hypothetical protein